MISPMKIPRFLFALVLLCALTVSAQEIEKKDDPEQRLKDLGQKIASAHTSAEVREATDALNGLMSELRKGNAENQNLQNERIQAFRRTAQRWSQILVLEEQGSVSAALQRLQEMERDSFNQDLSWLPADLVKTKRQALLQKLVSNEEIDDPIIKQVDQIVASIKSPSDITDARMKIERLSRVVSSLGSSQQSIFNLVAELNSMEVAMRAGDPSSVTLFRGAISSSPWQDKLAPIREQILATSLVTRFDLPEFSTAKGETVVAKLEGLADAAAERGEWAKTLEYLKALGVARGYAGNYGIVLGYADSEFAGISAFVAGQNLEKADQYATAADCYRAVLRSMGKRVPTKAATERLLAITKDHPEVAQSITSTHEGGPPFLGR